MKKLISVVIPAYNEEAVLDELKKRLKEVMATNSNYDFEIIIVENGSWDSSFEKLIRINKEDPRFKIVQMSRNFGCDGAITAGLKYAKGDAAVIMNADLQDPPEMIFEFIKKWEEGYEIVYGIIEKRIGVSFTRKILSSIAYKIIYHLSNKMIPANVSDFRLIDKKVYTIVNKMEERNKFLRGIIAWTGFKQIGIPFDRPARFGGGPSANFFAVFKVAINGIFSFSYFPLRAVSVLGMVVSTSAFIMGITEIYLFLLYGRVVQGFTTLIVVMLFLFGTLFFILGVMGEYIARIYDEVKQRPNFIVKNEIGFN
ncbi:MAG: glycosyltransferase family 2 protein [Candidatus Omnitrophica bacterium]|nr:glycosyltransferase family 2 protein [Candidatus Omnitrophota bacterium]